MLPDDSEEDDLFREESMLRKIIEIDETACNGCGANCLLKGGRCDA